MIHFPFFCFCFCAGLTWSTSLWILNKPLDCNQPGLDNCKINNCSDKGVFLERAPTGPEWGPEHVGVGIHKYRTVPLIKVIWKLKSDAGILHLNGSEVRIVDVSTNQSVCVQFSYTIHEQLNPNHEMWTFALDGVVVEPEHTYMVSVVNLPEPKSQGYRIRRQIIVQGCGDSRIHAAQICLENGSLWEPNLAAAVFVDGVRKKLFIGVYFEASDYSKRYQVSIQSQTFHYAKNVSKDNGTSLNVTFEFGLMEHSQCEMSVLIQPFFIRCKDDCQRHEKQINYCHYYQTRTSYIKAVAGLLFIIGLSYFLWRASNKDSADPASSAAKDQPSGFHVRERKRVLIIYSLDHPLYKNIVLKLCGFLVTKCGIEVVLDLLDSARLGVLGSIQWLDWHREQMESSSNKILILCSPGVRAKWRAMCGGKGVHLREDVNSPMGDMLTPALALLVPQFVRSASFEKYIVAYFDGVCAEEDVPSPFNITVRYKLMKQFEEVVFRILDAEKCEPGRVNCIEGLSADKFHRCPSGRALRDAVEAFRAYQLTHPRWFENELLQSPELEIH